jgi:hypothetical protein
MADYIDILFKIGDADTHTPDAGIKDGMIAGYIDPDEWGFQPEYSDWMQRVYLITRVSKTWKPAVINAIQPILNNSLIVTPEVSNIKRFASGFLDFEQLQTESGETDLVSRVRQGEKVDVLDLRDKTSITTSILKDSSKYTVTGMRDINTITSGTYLIGSSFDYTTWYATWLDLGNLTGNMNLLQVGSTTETNRIISTVTLGGYTLTCDNLSYHYGRYAKGNVISLNLNNFGISPGFNGSGTCVIQNLSIKTIYTLTTRYHSFTPGASPSSGYTLIVRNIMVDKNSNIGAGFAVAFNNITYQFTNCVAIGQLTSSPQNGGFFFDSGSPTVTFENCAAVDCYEGWNMNSLAATLRNCIGYNCGDKDFYLISNSTGRYNASEDASAANENWSSGAGNYTSLASWDADSWTYTDDSFLVPSAAGALEGMGEANTLTRTSCIRLRPVPNSGSSTSKGPVEKSSTKKAPVSIRLARARMQ